MYQTPKSRKLSVARTAVMISAALGFAMTAHAETGI